MNWKFMSINYFFQHYPPFLYLLKADCTNQEITMNPIPNDQPSEFKEKIPSVKKQFLESEHRFPHTYTAHVHSAVI